MHTRKWLRPVLLLAALSPSLACDGDADPLGASTDEGDAGSETGDPPPDLEGRWGSACVPSPQADGSTQYFDLELELGSSRWALDYGVHADDACSTPLATVFIEGPYSLTLPSAAVDGAWEATFGFETKTLTPHADAITGFLATQEGCGAAPWETGVAQDVLATGCAAFGQYPGSACAADYDLVAYDGEVLRLGARPADNDMCTPDRRPTELSPLPLERR